MVDLSSQGLRDLEKYSDGTWPIYILYSLVAPTRKGTNALRLEGGGDESKRQRAESQWIVAARPLCHLQYPVAYLSRLQRILPAAQWKLYFEAVDTARPPCRLSLRHVPLGAEGPYCGSAIGRRVSASLLARILT